MMSFAVSDFYQNGGSRASLCASPQMTPPRHRSPSIPIAPVHLLARWPATTPRSSSRPPVRDRWGNQLGVIIDLNTKNTADPTLFNLTAQFTDPTGTRILAQEKFLNLSINPASSRYVVTYLAQNSQLVAVQEDPHNPGDYIVPGRSPAATPPSVLSPPTSPPQTRVLPQFMSGGADGDLDITDMDLIGNPAGKVGLYALENAPLFNLLVIPPYNSSGGSPVDVDPTVQAAAAYVVGRRAFYIMDPPSSWTNVTSAVNGFSDVSANVGAYGDHAALYFPMLVEANPLNDGQLQNFVPCGAVAGIYARTDAQRGVWKAPAGHRRDTHRRSGTRRPRSPTPRTACSIRSASTACALPDHRPRRLGRAHAARAPTRWPSQ